MSFWIPYLAYKGGRAVYRGIKNVVANQYAQRAAGRMIGATGASLAGMAVSAARNAFRRRRRARAWAYMKDFRRRSALGLANVRYLSSAKSPAGGNWWESGSRGSRVQTFCPLFNRGSGSSGSVTYQGATTVFNIDPRFKAMCGLYKQFRIVSFSLSLCYDVSGDIGVEGPFTLFARVIRNWNTGTLPTDFSTGANYECAIPGVIWRRQYDNMKKLMFSISVRPRSTLEKLQWYSTDYTASGNSVDINAGVDVDFNPAIDVMVLGRSAPSDRFLLPCDIFQRIVVEFRDATDGGDSAASKTLEIEMNSKSITSMSNAIKTAKADIPSILDSDTAIVQQ